MPVISDASDSGLYPRCCSAGYKGSTGNVTCPVKQGWTNLVSGGCFSTLEAAQADAYKNKNCIYNSYELGSPGQEAVWNRAISCKSKHIFAPLASSEVQITCDGKNISAVMDDVPMLKASCSAISPRECMSCYAESMTAL